MSSRGPQDPVREQFDQISAQPRARWDELLEAQRLAGVNPDIIAQVRHLLGFVVDAVSSPAGEVAKPLQAHRAELERAIHHSQPRRIGRYTVVRVLGEGGMGTVYEAKQEQPRRTVALKVIRAGYLSPELQGRFEREAEVLGRLQHPGIAQVYEADTYAADDGTSVPFFAMEFIAGAKPITGYCSAKLLDLPARVNLFVTVCDAVHYAHMRGIVHRDLKPGNILVDIGGRARIIDFGVVKLTDSDVHTTLGTAAGQILGTLQYMSPEQCDGDPHILDLRSDIYSLGAVLYELVCRRTPHDVAGKRLVDAIQIIRSQDPVPPGRINPGLAGDLEAIILKAMERDPDRRYQSVHGLGLDLRRFLAGEPVQARAQSATYTLRKVLWRWRREAIIVFFSLAVILLSVSRLAGDSTWAAVTILGGGPLVVIALSVLSIRSTSSKLSQARSELADVRQELHSLQTMHRATQSECRVLRDRLDQVQVRLSEACADLINEVQGFGGGPNIKASIDRAVHRILSAADKARREGG